MPKREKIDAPCYREPCAHCGELHVNWLPETAPELWACRKCEGLNFTNRETGEIEKYDPVLRKGVGLSVNGAAAGK